MRLVNVGLVKNDGSGTLDPREVEAEFRRYAPTEMLGIVQSDTEQTAVLSISHPLLSWDAEKICRKLRQDCFAVFDPKSKWGYLQGPRADAWGEFNPAFFFMADGRRLSETPEAEGARPLYIPPVR